MTAYGIITSTPRDLCALDLAADSWPRTWPSGKCTEAYRHRDPKADNTKENRQITSHSTTTDISPTLSTVGFKMQNRRLHATHTPVQIPIETYRGPSPNFSGNPFGEKLFWSFLTLMSAEADAHDATMSRYPTLGFHSHILAHLAKCQAARKLKFGRLVDPRFLSFPNGTGPIPMLDPQDSPQSHEPAKPARSPPPPINQRRAAAASRVGDGWRCHSLRHVKFDATNNPTTPAFSRSTIFESLAQCFVSKWEAVQNPNHQM